MLMVEVLYIRIFIENLHRSSGPFLYVSSHVWCDLRGVALALLKPGSGGVPLNPDRSIVKPGLSVDLNCKPSP